MVNALHIAKLAMLLLPEAYLVLPSVLLVLAVSAPAFVYEAEPTPLPASGAIAGQSCSGEAMESEFMGEAKVLHQENFIMSLMTLWLGTRTHPISSRDDLDSAGDKT